MVKQVIPSALFGLGLLLLILGANWIAIQPPTSLWSVDQETKLNQMDDAIVQMYQQMDVREAERLEARLRAGETDGELTRYEKAVAARNAFREQREVAMNRPKEIASALHWTGIAVVAVGVVSFYVVQQLPTN